MTLRNDLDKRYRVGFVGAGYIADFHARAISALSDARLVAVCDLSKARAERLAREHGAPLFYDNLEEMLAREELDVVHVLSPPNAHARPALRALEAGAHVLLEKPMATSIDECETLSSESRRLGRTIGVTHNFLFSTPYEKVRTALEQGLLGQIDTVEITWSRSLPQVRSGPFDSWMLRDPRNILLEVGPHSFAHCVDLVGDSGDVHVLADNATSLPTGERFYRRWHVVVGAGSSAVQLRFSFMDGYPEHRLIVRGTLASAIVDFERDTYQFLRHHPLSLDLDRFVTVVSGAARTSAQATRTVGEYALSKAGLTRFAAPYQKSINRAVGAFYEGLEGSLDDRLGPELGARVVRLAKRVGQASHLDASSRRGVRSVDEEPRPATVLVTGGTGFIGRELVRELHEAGYVVRILTRSRASVPDELRALGVDVCVGSPGDEAAVARALEGIEYVYHLARSYGTTWPELSENDVEVTRRFAEACQRAGVRRFVYASSIAIYHAAGSKKVITEETPADPAVLRTQPYARAKAETERILFEMHEQSGFPLVVFRPGIVVGPGGDPCHWGVGMWLYRSVCETWGAGTEPLPIVLVQDVADAMVRCLAVRGVEGQSFNLVGDTELTAQEYLDAMERSGKMRLERRATPIWQFYATDVLKWLIKTAVRHPNRALPSYRAWSGRRANARFDCSQARRVLGWSPAADRQRVVKEGIELPVAEFFG